LRQSVLDPLLSIRHRVARGNLNVTWLDQYFENYYNKWSRSRAKQNCGVEGVFVGSSGMTHIDLRTLTIALQCSQIGSIRKFNKRCRKAAVYVDPSRLNNAYVYSSLRARA
jgi:hypothetical protein